MNVGELYALASRSP